ASAIARAKAARAKEVWRIGNFLSTAIGESRLRELTQPRAGFVEGGILLGEAEAQQILPASLPEKGAARHGGHTRFAQQRASLLRGGGPGNAADIGQHVISASRHRRREPRIAQRCNHALALRLVVDRNLLVKRRRKLFESGGRGMLKRRRRANVREVVEVGDRWHPARIGRHVPQPPPGDRERLRES